MSRILPVCFLLCLSFVAHAAPCDGVSVERARFAAEIRDREPVGEPSVDADALWFFTEIHGAAGRTLHHQWFWRGEQVADVALRIGGDRWRTWSSKVVGTRRGDSWDVALRLEDGCLLGRYSLGAMLTDQTPVQASNDNERQGPRGQSFPEDEPRQDHDTSREGSDPAATIRGLLAAGDITGARLALAKTDQLDATQHERLTLEVSLARIDAQVANDELYLASARLEQFLNQPLPPALQRQARELKERLEKRRRAIDDRMAMALEIWEKSRREATGGLICVEDQKALQRDLQIVESSEHLMINPPRREEDRVVAEVLDRRTGLMHRVTQYCPQWGWE